MLQTPPSRFGSLVNNPASNAPGEFEEVRGLDDIFPAGVAEISAGISEGSPRHLAIVNAATEALSRKVAVTGRLSRRRLRSVALSGMLGLQDLFAGMPELKRESQPKARKPVAGMAVAAAFPTVVIAAPSVETPNIPVLEEAIAVVEIAQEEIPQIETMPVSESIAIQVSQQIMAQEPDADLTGFDYMLRNNRILSKSITNLADAYFEKARREEAST